MSIASKMLSVGVDPKSAAWRAARLVILACVLAACSDAPSGLRDSAPQSEAARPVEQGGLVLPWRLRQADTIIVLSRVEARDVAGAKREKLDSAIVVRREVGVPHGASVPAVAAVGTDSLQARLAQLSARLSGIPLEVPLRRGGSLPAGITTKRLLDAYGAGTILEIDRVGGGPPTELRYVKNGSLAYRFTVKWRRTQVAWALESFEMATPDGRWRHTQEFRHRALRENTASAGLLDPRLVGSDLPLSFDSYTSITDCVTKKCADAKEDLENAQLGQAAAVALAVAACGALPWFPTIPTAAACVAAMASVLYADRVAATAHRRYQRCLSQAATECRVCPVLDERRSPTTAGRTVDRGDRVAWGNGGAQRSLSVSARPFSTPVPAGIAGSCTVDWEFDPTIDDGSETPVGSAGGSEGLGDVTCWFMVYYNIYGEVVYVELLYCEENVE